MLGETDRQQTVNTGGSEIKVRAVWTRRQPRCGLGEGAGVQERGAVTIEKPPSGPLGGGDISAGPEVRSAGEWVPRTVRAVREGTGRSGVALTGWHSCFDPEKTCCSRQLLMVSSAARREAAGALTGEGRKWQTTAPQS